MKLHSLEIERRLLRRVREAIPRSGPLWKEYKRRRIRLRDRLPLRWLVALVIPIYILLQSSIRGAGDLEILLLLALYATATTVTRTKGFLVGLHQSSDLAICLHFPISNDEFYRWLRHLFLWRSLVVLCVSLIGNGYVIFQDHGSPASWVAGGFMAIAQWLLVLALGALLARFENVLNTQVLSWLPAICYLLIPIAMFAPAVADAISPAQYVVPSGWINYAFFHGVLLGETGAWFALLPIVGIIAFLPTTENALRTSFLTRKLELPPPEILNPDLADKRSSADAEPEPTPEAFRAWPSLFTLREKHLPGRNESRIRNSEFLTLPNWTAAGWLEEWFGRWLSPREHMVADFLLAGEIGWWSRHWKLGSIFVLGGAVGAAVGREFAPWVFVLFGVLPMVIGSLLAVPVLGGDWAGLKLQIASMCKTSLSAMYPVTYFEASRVIMKANLLRLLGGVPLVLVSGTVLSILIDEPVIEGVKVASLILFAVFISNPFAIVGKFSQGTNDTRRFIPAAILCLVGFAIVVIGVFGSVAIFWAPTPTLAKFPIAAVMLALPSAFWCLYGWVYDRGKFDLLAKP